MVSYVVISTFLLMFLHQIFYKSAIVIEINMALGLPVTFIISWLIVSLLSLQRGHEKRVYGS